MNNIEKIAKQILAAEDISVKNFIQKVSDDFETQSYDVPFIKTRANLLKIDLKGKEREITNLINSSLVKAVPGIIREALWTYSIIDD